jgi:hypothetical protein
MSNELVPMQDVRNAYNALHGTEFKHHTDALTAEQAARINGTYDIEIFGGLHGLIKSDNTEAFEPIDWLKLPTQEEYDQAAAVVAGMEPGDVLFLEGYGFNKPLPESGMSPEHLPSTMNIDTDTLHMLGELATSIMNVINTDKVQADAHTRLEQERRDYRITAWEYAYKLAALKGVRTVYADHDVFDQQAFEALTGGRTLRDLRYSSDADSRLLVRHGDEQRERSIRNIVKDWALEHLPPERAATPSGRKPKLVPLLGIKHGRRLKQRFDDVGLNAQVTEMKFTSVEERAREQASRIAKAAIGKAV